MCNQPLKANGRVLKKCLILKLMTPLMFGNIFIIKIYTFLF